MNRKNNGKKDSKLDANDAERRSTLFGSAAGWVDWLTGHPFE